MTSVIDTAVLSRLIREVGDGTVATLIDLFLEDSVVLLSELQEAMAAREFARVKRPAHTLKSMSQTLGASTLGTLCAQLEALGSDEATHETAETTVVAVARQCEATNRALEHERRKLSHGR